MAKPPRSELSLKESLERLKSSGIRVERATDASFDPIDPLDRRIQATLNILRVGPIKATEMIYLIMYDISDDKVRHHVAKYLKRNGCIRIQRSVFMLRSENKRFEEISATLKDINEYYENEDSIILVPVNASDVRSMKLLGKNVAINTFVDPPGTIFF